MTVARVQQRYVDGVIDEVGLEAELAQAILEESKPRPQLPPPVIPDPFVYDLRRMEDKLCRLEMAGEQSVAQYRWQVACIWACSCVTSAAAALIYFLH